MPTLPSLSEQAARLVSLGVPDLTGVTAESLDAAAQSGRPGLLAIHPDRAPASALTPLLSHGGQPGFVVTDLTDVDRFAPTPEAPVPQAEVYVVDGLDGGDRYANWSPDEALPAILADGRTPLLLTEGIHWLLQVPEVLERNHCFMTIGSRLRTDKGRLDARVPAIWISNGTGRDGPSARNAPKVGWCWAGNRHTWLGIASAAARSGG